MTTRREFLRRACLTSLATAIPVARAVAPPSTPAPLLIDGQQSGTFVSDPYSAYPTRLVDGTIASDVGGGTTMARNCGFGNASFQVYKTVAFGIRDWLAGAAGRRLGVLNTATYSQTANLVMPNAGTADNSRCILQGDPSVAANAMPAIVFSGPYGIAVGCGYNGSTTAAPYVTLRKLDISGSSVTNPIYGGPDYDYSGLVVEYCAVHDIIGASGPNIGAVHVDVDFGGPPAIIRYNKLYNINPPVGRNLNCSAVNSFKASAVQVYNNAMWNANNGVFIKQPGKRGWTIRNNVIYNCATGIWLSQAGGGNGPTAHTDDQVYRNLIYGLSSGGGAMYVDDNSNTAQNSGLTFYQNTVGEDVSTGWYVGNMMGAQIHSNAFLSSTCHIANVYADAANQIALSDYNRFLAGSQTFELERYKPGGNPSVTSLAAWKAMHTKNPTYADLLADPDAHSATCALADFPNRAARDYTYSAGAGRGYGGVDIGYDPANCGPGW